MFLHFHNSTGADRQARACLDDSGINYAVRISRPDRNDRNTRLFVEIPDVNPDKTANGYAFYESPGAFDLFGTSRAAMVCRYETAKKVMEHAAKNFGFTNVSEISPNAQITQVCVMPRTVSRDELSEFLGKALKKGTFVWKGELARYSTAGLSVTLKEQPSAKVDMHYRFADDVTGLMSDLDGILPLRIPCDAEVSMREKESYTPEPGIFSRVFGVVGNAAKLSLRTAFSPIWKCGGFVLKKGNDKYAMWRDISGYEALVREKVITRELKSLGLPENKEFSTSCVTVIGPELQAKIDKEVADEVKEYTAKYYGKSA